MASAPVPISTRTDRSERASRSKGAHTPPVLGLKEALRRSPATARTAGPRSLDQVVELSTVGLKSHELCADSRTCFERFGSLVKYWLTFNEIDSVMRHPFTTAGIIPDRSKNGVEQACYTALLTMWWAAYSLTSRWGL